MLRTDLMASPFSHHDSLIHCNCVTVHCTWTNNNWPPPSATPASTAAPPGSIAPTFSCCAVVQLCAALLWLICYCRQQNLRWLLNEWAVWATTPASHHHTINNGWLPNPPNLANIGPSDFPPCSFYSLYIAATAHSTQHCIRPASSCMYASYSMHIIVWHTCIA